MSATFDSAIPSEGLRLAAHVARPTRPGLGPGPGLVLCHGFPAGPASTSAQTYPDLADRLCADTGWTVMTFNFRGAGASTGNFSLGGWLHDVGAAVDALLAEETVGAVWLVGSSTGGALSICAAAEDGRVRGVATLAAPAEFDTWGVEPRAFFDLARERGVIRDRQFPPDFEAWARELREIRPLAVVGKLAPRPLLLMHGADDDLVSIADARALADAAGEGVELRVIGGAGHRLRHDPRAIAALLGWMERQKL